MSPVTHRMSGSSEYSSWKNMIGRCYQPATYGYYRYGGRGITVCDRWRGRGGFERFLEDMGIKPSSRHTLDRYPDNDGNYEPGNCRWATRKQQDQGRYKGPTKMVNFRLSPDHIWKLEGIARDLSRRLKTPQGKTDAVRHLINTYQTRSV